MNKKKLLLSLSLLFLASSCATTPGTSGEAIQSEGTYRLVGKTRYQGKSLSSGQVIALRAEPGGVRHNTGIEGDGTFSMDLPSGPYLLMGWSTEQASGKELFAYWINNPFRLHRNVDDPVVLPFVEATPPPRAVGNIGLRGRVVYGGRPVSGAVVAAFLNAAGEFHGLPYAESGPSDEEGMFSLPLAPGSYFLLARWRAGGGPYQGPLLKGDLAGFYPHNPVVLRTGEGLLLDIPMARINRPRGEGSLAYGETIIVEGTIRTVTGEAADGIRMVLYDIPEMLGRPAFISSPSDEGGRYRLEVSRGGKYYAAARSVIGRPPETGELVGYYDGTEDHSIMLEIDDRVEGIDIVVREMW